MGLKLIVEDKESSTHEISILLGIKMPEIVAADEVINHSFRGNPIWANAITAQGSIEIKNSRSYFR